jgi:hypothetical protein
MKKNIYLLIPLMVLSFILPQTVFGIGQMTKPIVLQDVLWGQEVTAILKFHNSEDKEITFQLRADGEISDWASFYKIEDENFENPITDIQIPSESFLKAIVKFKVPEETPNGEYIGEVAIMTTPSGEEDIDNVGASVFQRVAREVRITVTDEEIIQFDTAIIPLRYDVKSGEPLKIKVIYDNQSNVSIKPSIQLKITQISTGKVVQSTIIYPYPENENPVRSFERKVFENLIEWSTAGQENGRYRAEIKVLLNSQVIEEDDFKFTVGLYDWDKLLASIAAIGGGSLTLAWFIIGGILAIIAGILTVFHKRPKFFKIGMQRIRSIF